MSIRVLVVAEDSLARAGLATLLGGQPNLAVTGQIAGGPELALEVYRPEVIVWDYSSMAARTLERQSFRELGIPVIAMLPDAGNATRAWSAGARGLVVRDASAETLAAAIAAVAEGLTVIDPIFTAVLLPERDLTPPPPAEELTPRERQVLRLMAEGQSNKAIARELGISEHTVKFHVNAILGKLNVQSRTEAVVHATRLGLILL